MLKNKEFSRVNGKSFALVAVPRNSVAGTFFGSGMGPVIDIGQMLEV
jgi:hypothetical protein